ncbi:MAG: L-fucose/L-arabinose isomerase family protein [Promethearchaeota archaeon]
MKQKIRIGVVCLARKTFDFQAAQDLFKQIQEKLMLIENVAWEIIPDLIFEVEEAQDAGQILATKSIDGLICINGTFALGHLILEINKRIRVPILLWGLEELPYDGGKIRLNSICGLNLNASNLYKAGIRNYHYCIGDEIDKDWLDAIRILKTFSTAHIGIIGSRAHGFFNVNIDELDLYKQLGVLIDYYQLEELLNMSIENAKVKKRIEELKSYFDVSELNEQQLRKVAELIVRLDEFMKVKSLTSVAIRCWPEFAEYYGISPCAAMSVLQAERKILACEGDILGSLSMLAHVAIGGQYPFLADFSQVNFKENFALLWHCGVAPFNLWDQKCTRSLDTYFAGGKGVTAGFVLKSGDLSILRLDYSPPNEYRIFLQQGKAVPMAKELKGTYAKVVFKEDVRNALNKIIENGIAHHVSVVYGNFIKPFEILAKLKEWKVIK